MSLLTLADILDCADFSEMMRLRPAAQCAPIVRTISGVEAAFGLRLQAIIPGIDLALICAATPKGITPTAYCITDLRSGMQLCVDQYSPHGAAIQFMALMLQHGSLVMTQVMQACPGLPSDN